MDISIVAVGKLKEKYLKQGIDEYVKRLQPFAKIHIIEVADEKASEKLSAQEEEQVKAKEGERLLAKIPADAHLILLDLDGQQLTSEAFSEKLDTLATYGKSKIAFAIGGSLGLSPAVRQRANLKLSLSKMTLPHQLARLVLIEQVYRAFKIMRGGAYHK
ncbi:23S rRNA (pseudouridine(1915)-N(3))-methyltransferase RlmH [Bacillaceae bacterium SIJ1]|uniref:23S rRNA (pseudouridine(1915)-N(3))-methyltransferase RlmH n=1 Tax=Litoribacterium kuwaitense TaxID=1398745 RepID=UPI0013EC5A82|nr:23S rRNA (pseudouridine(1915)-N(3))-methyltransferase RlmH [Litoribacterium kuwaitense]NGP46874.1 23S rRNA (pseudouridine(1915)-N(3))-methyltransferase RlmH [Litoribacterium kuwaitense]